MRYRDQLLELLERKDRPKTGPAAELKDADLLALYKAMVVTRVTDERCLNLQRQGRIGFYVPSTGQEASVIGSAYAMRATDWIVPSYRETGAWLLRGFPVQDLINELYGNAADKTKGRQMPNHQSFAAGHMVSVSSPIGTQITQAVGVAMAAKIRKQDTVVLTYFGDGSTSSNDFHVGLNFGGVFKSPVVFFCQNNGWAITLPRERQTASETIAQKAVAYGFDGLRVDGNDVLAVYEVTRKAVDKARAGGGPTLIEAVTYRMGPHSTSDDPNRYREAAECEAWAKKDPIARFRRYLAERGLLTDPQDAAMREEAKETVNAAIVSAEKNGPPALETIFSDVYASLTPQLAAQRDELLALRKTSKKGH